MKNKERGVAPILVLLILALATAVFIKLPRNIAPIKPNSNQALLANPLPQQTKEQTQVVSGQNSLEKYLTVEAALLGVADNASLYFKDLTSNYTFSIEPTKSWIPASTIKSYLVLEAFRQRNLGLINFDDKVTIKAQNVVPTELETDEFPKLSEGIEVTIRQLIEAMVIQSDNTAYNTLLDILDRRNINLSLRNIGLTETVVGEKLNLDGSQFQEDLKVSGRQPNTTTVKDLAAFFDLLYSKKIQSSDEILAIFKRQKLNNMIPALLPQSTQVAHKTGDWAPIYHDGGVVFKPDSPFILTVFTNSGDPSVVAKLAKVAYYQTADSVGTEVSFNSNKGVPISQSPFEKLTLVNKPSENKVLAAETDQKFPTVTAEDLGITTADINFGPKAAKDLRPAFITPGSLLYGLKNFIENRRLQGATSDKDKAETQISLAKDKLAEVKALLESGNTADVDQLINESESYLKEAVVLAKKEPVNKDLLLVQIKQVNDLHFAVLNQEASKISKENKSKFIDTVYNFYQKNRQEVTPIINASVIANPLQQKPAIGTVTKVEGGNNVTIQFDDGTVKQLVLTDNTKVRAFQQTSYENSSSIKSGDKVAIIGLTAPDSKIIPEFILKNVPKELPSKHTGTVIEINPDENTIRILNQKGEEENIKISEATKVKSKDTTVSLSGIAVGSVVTAFGSISDGQNQTGSSDLVSNLVQTIKSSGSSPNPATSPTVPLTLSPVPKTSESSNSRVELAPTSKLDSSKVPSGNQTQPRQAPTQNISPAKQVELKATSVTVTVNSSGKNEIAKPKEEPKKEEPKKEEPKKTEPKKEEPKKQEHKK